MLPAKRAPVTAQARAGLRPMVKRPMPVCPVTVLPFLTREGGAVPSDEILPERAVVEQGNPPPDRGPTDPWPFPPDPDPEEE